MEVKMSKFIKVTDDYYIQVVNPSYVVCKKVLRPNAKTKELFMYPSYHTTFLDAVENIRKRLVKEELKGPEVETVKDAIEAMKKVNEKMLTYLKSETGLEETEKYLQSLYLDENSEEEDDTEDIIEDETNLVE